MQISKLCLRGDCVDLAHVASFILLLNVWYVKEPCAMLIVFIMRHTDARISGYYMIMYS